MSGVTISNLPSGAPVEASDILPVVRSGVTYKVPVSSFNGVIIGQQGDQGIPGTPGAQGEQGPPGASAPEGEIPSPVMQFFPPEAALYPTSNYATFKSISGTNFPVNSLAFDETTDETVFFRGMLKGFTEPYVEVRLRWYADTATSGNVIWGVSMAAITPNLDTQDIETKAFGTETTVTATHLGTTAQRLQETTLVLTSTDSLTDLDDVTLRITRKASSDTMAGDAQLVGVMVVNSSAPPPPAPPAPPVGIEPIWDTRFAGLSWSPGYDDTSRATGKNKSYILTGTDSVTSQVFSGSTPTLWGGVNTGRNNELQIICGSTRTETPDQLYTRTFSATDGPGSTPCLELTKNYDYIAVDQASQRWFSDSFLVNQSMAYVRLKMQIDPTFPTSGLSFIGLTEVKFNNYDSGGDQKLELSIGYDAGVGGWLLQLSSVRAGRGIQVWGLGTTPTVNSDPVQSGFFTSSWESRYYSQGIVTAGSGASPPPWGTWLTIEFAFRLRDPNNVVAGGSGNGWAWAAMSQGTSTTAPANGTGAQRFYVPGVNMASPANKGAWCLFPYLYYTDAAANGKWMRYASVEVYDQFPTDASPRTGAAAGIG